MQNHKPDASSNNLLHGENPPYTHRSFFRPLRLIHIPTVPNFELQNTAKCCRCNMNNYEQLWTWHSMTLLSRDGQAAPRSTLEDMVVCSRASNHDRATATSLSFWQQRNILWYLESCNIVQRFHNAKGVPTKVLWASNHFQESNKRWAILLSIPCWVDILVHLFESKPHPSYSSFFVHSSQRDGFDGETISVCQHLPPKIAQKIPKVGIYYVGIHYTTIHGFCGFPKAHETKKLLPSRAVTSGCRNHLPWGQLLPAPAALLSEYLRN